MQLFKGDSHIVQSGNASDTTWLPTLLPMQVMSPDDQILNQFARNQKMHIWKKYKTEILLIWRWQIQEYLNRDLAVRESRHVSWFWFLPEEVGRVHAHLWIQVQVHDQHYYTKMIPFITRLRFRAGRLVFSPRRTCPQVSPTSLSWFWTSTSSTLTRQLASSSSMTRRMQRRLPTVWWSWRAATWRPCGHQQPASLPQRPPDI